MLDTQFKIIAKTLKLTAFYGTIANYLGVRVALLHVEVPESAARLQNPLHPALDHLSARSAS